MKIAKLTIHNFLKLKDVEMNPSDTNVIVGKNKQGKTSILKAIRTAFLGDADASSIRIGEGKAEITIELDEYIIKRSITEKGNHLDISNKEGMKMPAPQRFLDGMIGTFSFNPIEFFDKKPADRKKYLLGAIKLTITQEELAEYTGEKLEGLDYDAHALEVVEQARQFYYDKRAIVNSEVVKKKKALQELTEKIPEGFDPSKVSVEEIDKFRKGMEADKLAKQAHESHRQAFIKLQGEEKDIEGQVLALQEKLAEVQKEIVEMTKKEFSYSDDLSMEAAEETLKILEGQREIVFTVKLSDDMRKELDVSMKSAKELDDVVKKLAKDVPKDLIAKAELPIEGLTVSEDDIFINDVSVDNLSASEQLKFGLEIVRALNGEFKVVCIDGIETLDKESFEFFLKEIEKDDFQYFVTRVDGEHEHSIVVDEGEIKA